MFIIRKDGHTIAEFWRNYWNSVHRDPDRIDDATIYPLFPIDEYIKPGMRILEAGCGMGRVFKHYFYSGYDIIGLEYDIACLKRLHVENPEFRLFCADARRLPVATDSMDLVMAFGLVSSIESSPREVLAELRRVARNGGLVCASAACDNLLRRLQNVVAACLGWLSHITSTTKAERRFFAWAWTPEEWRAELTQAGLEVVRVEPTHSRVLFWQYLPFLRGAPTDSLDLGEARNGDVGYRLNALGERLFRWARETIPWVIAVGVVAVARKRS